VDAYLEQAAEAGRFIVSAARGELVLSGQATVLLAAAAVLAILLVLTLLFIVFTPRTRRVVKRRRVIRRPRGEEAAVGGSTSAQRSATAPDVALSGAAALDAGPQQESDPVLERRPTLARRALLAPWLVPVLILLFLAGTYGYTGTTHFCTAYCHMASDESEGGESAMATQRDSAHHELCSSCHDSGVAGNIADRTRMVVVRLSTGTMGVEHAAVVESKACLRCHRSVLRGTLTSGPGTMLVSHAEPHEAGMNCVDCHQRIGHTDLLGPVMADCIECHDSVTASATCETCHVGNPADSAVAADGTRVKSSVVYSPVEVDHRNCYGCHETASCDACHGVRLPHSESYIYGGHAYDAAWEKKEVCYRCHTVADCQECHLTFAASHGPNFKEEHKAMSPTATCSCHDQRYPARAARIPFCEACHAP